MKINMESIGLLVCEEIYIYAWILDFTTGAGGEPPAQAKLSRLREAFDWPVS